MKLTKDQIIGALPTLSLPALIAIKTVTGELIKQRGGEGQPNPDNAQGWLFMALAGVLNTGHRVPDSVKPFNKNAPSFLAFINANFAEAVHKKVDGLAVMTGLLQLLVSDLKAQHIPVTYNTVATHMPRIAEVFERAFPGYLSSGLARIWLKCK